MVEDLYALFDAACSTDSNSSTNWRTFLNTLYSRCNSTVQPSWFLEYRNEETVCGGIGTIDSDSVFIVTLLCCFLYKIIISEHAVSSRGAT